jgi:hypothetical protein
VATGSGKDFYGRDGLSDEGRLLEMTGKAFAVTLVRQADSNQDTTPFFGTLKQPVTPVTVNGTSKTPFPPI